jgi:hypothetical protein
LLETTLLTMNPYSPEQKYALKLVERATERCKQELENTEFLISVKEELYDRVQQGVHALDHPIYDEPLILDNGIVIPSPRVILEHEARYHAETIDYQKNQLANLKEAAVSLDNGMRKHKQNYDYKFERLIKKSHRSKSMNNSASSSSHD